LAQAWDGHALFVPVFLVVMKLLCYNGMVYTSFLQYHYRSGSSFHLKGKVVTLQTVEIVDRSTATLFVGPPSKPPPLQKLQDLNNGP
jgi:hypothetical protein